VSDAVSEEILINVTPVETRIALIEHGLLQEISIERYKNRGHVGDIFQGKVARVMPGMGAAFVDIGLGKTGFLHYSDIAALGADGFELQDQPSEDIQSLLREGQSVVVQVAKDAIGTKGARLSTRLTLPSRNLVYLPRSKHLGISQRLENEVERDRLMVQLQDCLEAESWNQQGGFIVRTSALGAQASKFTEDIRYLKRLWEKVDHRISSNNEVKTVYRDRPLYLRTVRDLLSPQSAKIRVDDLAAFDVISQFLKDFVPELPVSVEHYLGEHPIFDLYGIEDEIDKALDRQVMLKSGGYLVIDQTEAMTTIDVNTGGFVGSSNQAETILKTNLEAANAIARQLRVRNLGGIIIIDLIDMLDIEHQRQVQRTLSSALKKDHARTSVSEISQLGLIEMTRKRIRESLGQILNSHCPVCAGRGRQKSAETVCCEIFREIMRKARSYENDTLLVLASQVVVDRLLDEESKTLDELEEIVGKAVNFEVEPMYTQEQFNVVLF
jgi:ribonuclease G